MTHPSESISAYLDGEMTSDERSEFLRHLASCGKCSVDMQEIQEVRASIRALPVVELPDDLAEELGHDTETVPLRRNKGLWVGAAAAAVALVIAVAALVTPEPATVSVDDLSSRFGARVSLDPAFGPAKVIVPAYAEVRE